jgi:hypothetical protein
LWWSVSLVWWALVAVSGRWLGLRRSFAGSRSGALGAEACSMSCAPVGGSAGGRWERFEAVEGGGEVVRPGPAGLEAQLGLAA